MCVVMLVEKCATRTMASEADLRSNHASDGATDDHGVRRGADAGWLRWLSGCQRGRYIADDANPFGRLSETMTGVAGAHRCAM